MKIQVCLVGVIVLLGELDVAREIEELNFDNIEDKRACEVVTSTSSTTHYSGINEYQAPDSDEFGVEASDSVQTIEAKSIHTKSHTMAEFWIVTMVIGIVFAVLFNE